MSSRTRCLSALVLLASACVHAPPGPAGESPAPHLRTPAESAPEPEEDRHTDPVPDPAAGDQVSLGGILAYADEHSPVLAVARSTRSRAEAARVAAAIVLPYNPQVSIAAGPRMGTAGVGVDVEAGLTQQLQIAGQRRTRIDAAAQIRDLTDAEIEQVRWSVHCDVHAAFHLALIAQEQVRLAKRVVEFQQEVLRVVERQIAAGETAALTLRLAEAEVAQAEQVLVSVEQEFLASRIRLAQLSGWPVVGPPLPSGAVDSPRVPPPIDELLAFAAERQPNLQVAAARVDAASAQVDVADREAWPDPSVGLAYRREGNPSEEGPYNVVMGTITIPIPSFQRNQGDRARARAEVSVAEAELDAAGQLLAGQIAIARSEVVAAAKRTRTYGTEILPRFEENLTLLRRSFELGEIDILALSTGRERFLRIQSDAIAAQRDYFVALAGLERVVGVELWRDDHHAEDLP